LFHGPISLLLFRIYDFVQAVCTTNSVKALMDVLRDIGAQKVIYWHRNVIGEE